MNRSKHLRTGLLCLLAVLLLPVSALAAGRIDVEAGVRLTLRCAYDGAPLKGVTFRLYRVAAVEETGELTVLDAFRDYPVDWDIRGSDRADEWTALASTLAGYAGKDQWTADASGKTDENGQLTFPAEGGSLAQGLYLVLGEKHRQNGYDYTADPFMVQVPGRNSEENLWDYAVESTVKFDRKSVPSGGETVNRKVLKKWDDDGETRPSSVTVALLKDGKVYDTVTLSAANGWKHLWTDLSADAEWMVTEEVPEGYTVSVRKDGITFVVTNRQEELPVLPEVPEEPDNPDAPTLPQTGQLWWPVPVLLCGGLALVCVGLLRRKADEA